jgi:nicotinamidase-related amidase
MNSEKRHRALLVIDVQNEYFIGKLPVSYPAGSLAKITSAMDAARAQHVPIILVQHTAPQSDSSTFRKGTSEWELHRDVASRPHDLLIEKRLPGSFTNTPLEEWLREHGVDTVVIAGYMTQMCCDTTARQAIHRGFNAEFLSDGTGTLDFKNEAGAVSAEELHRAILVTQQMRFSQVLTTAEWIRRIENH